MVIQQPQRTMADVAMATTDLRPADASAPKEWAEVQSLPRRGDVAPRRDAARSMRALVVIPTYNERENLGPLVTAVLAVDAGIDILIVDDHSPDGTGALAERLAHQTVAQRRGRSG